MSEKQVNISGGGTRFKGPLTIGAAVTALGALVAGVFLYTPGYSVSKGSDVNIPFELTDALLAEVNGYSSGALSIPNPLTEKLICDQITLVVRSVGTAFVMDVGTASGAIGVGIGSGVNLANNFRVDAAGVYNLTGSALFANGQEKSFVLAQSGATAGADKDFITFAVGGTATGNMNGSGSVACRRLDANQ